MVYNAANSQQSNTYQYPTDKKVRKLFEVPTYFGLQTTISFARQLAANQIRSSLLISPSKEY